MRPLIICNGDSWVFGSEILDPSLKDVLDPKLHVTSVDFMENNDHYRTPKIFSTHLAKILDTEVINLSWPADDNGSILDRTMNFITNNHLGSTQDLFVIIGWSSPERNSFWYKDINLSHHFRLWPQVPHFEAPAQKKIWELYVEHLWNAEEYIPRFIKTVVQFQNFCLAHNIKWLCFNSFYQTPNKDVTEWDDLHIPDELDKLEGGLCGYQYSKSSQLGVRNTELFNYKSLWSTVDPIRFYKKDQKRNTFKSFIEQSGITPVFNGWHPSPESHEIWAKELVRYINEHNLL